MYYPIKGGSHLEVQEYTCQLPPIGYGKNRLTGELEYIGVYKCSSVKKEQKWKRIVLPDDFEKRVDKEVTKQENDPDFFDPELDKIRVQHWRYRLCGFWLKINGVDTYINGSYFIYLNACPLDNGYPQYRNPDRLFFYVWEFCVEDPRCAGLVDIERRRMGKTFKSGSILLDRTSMFKAHHAGIQSKTGPDAKHVFQKTVVSFFKKWPSFFRPVFDKSKGLTPTSELRFFQTVVKGKRATEIIGMAELESWIDYGSSEPFFYDGSKLNTYVCDEFGKTMDCNVVDRWTVVRFCLDQDGEWVGKALFTTTVEEMENGGENGRILWEGSNPNDRNANGRTKTGMYRFFLPAYETMLFDEYGMPRVDQAKEFLLNERAGFQHDNRLLSATIRKNPFTIEEAFRVDGNKCLYDPIKLNIQLDYIAAQRSLIERGNFVWENGEPFTRVKWEKSSTGRFYITYIFNRPEDSNLVTKRNGHYFPANNHNITMGCDPFKYDTQKDTEKNKSMSRCAAFAFKKYDSTARSDPFGNSFIAMYLHRASTTNQQYDDLLKMSWYYGCQILFERNVDNWRHYFKARDCEAFLMKLPGEDDYGLYSDGHKLVHQQLCDYTEAYINEDCHKVMFKELLEDWLKFDVGNTTAYDAAMAAGYTLIAAKEKMYKRETLNTTRDITDYFKIHKAV